MVAARPDTWMPMYWGDYLRDTNHLSTAEHGAYLLLIGDYWVKRAAPPDDDVKLAKITRQGLASWRKMRGTIAALFEVGNGVWGHRRVEQEIAKAYAFIEKQAANGAKGGRPRKPTETQTKPTANPDHNPKITTSPSPNESSSSSTRTVAVGEAQRDGSARLAHVPSKAAVQQREAIQRAAAALRRANPAGNAT